MAIEPVYDPLNPPPEGIPADPLPLADMLGFVEEGDSAETDEFDDTRARVGLIERITHRRFNA